MTLTELGNGTGALQVPVGTTAEQPTTSVQGMLRYNTTLGQMEHYTATGYKDFTNL